MPVSPWLRLLRGQPLQAPLLPSLGLPPRRLAALVLIQALDLELVLAAAQDSEGSCEW